MQGIAHILQVYFEQTTDALHSFRWARQGYKTTAADRCSHRDRQEPIYFTAVGIRTAQWLILLLLLADELPQDLKDRIQQDDISIVDYTLHVGYDQMSADEVIRV